jgi:hypothetical protein
MCKALNKERYLNWPNLALNMGSMDLSEFNKDLLANCKCVWTQRIITNAKRITSVCDSPQKVKEFFDECEKKIRDPWKYCRISWNTQIHKFDGDEFSYVLYFSSEVLNSTIKLAVEIDSLEATMVLGRMEIASPKEERKLERHLNDGAHSSVGTADTTSSAEE